MPDTLGTPSPEKPAEKANIFESDVKELTTRIKEFKELPGAKLPPQEIVKQSIQAMAPPPPPQQQANEAVPPDIEAKVESLLSAALSEGIYKANSDAQKSHPFVMDSFHDALVGKFYPELQKRGIVD